MDLQTPALNALAPFLALSKSATSPRAAADLITQATSAPNTYVFAELLAQPNIQALQGQEEYGGAFELLKVFGWGTWETYQATPNLPALNDAQTLKLRLLSLLTIASEKASPNNLTYSTLSARLGLSSPIDLEHLITTAIYSSLLTATLNPVAQTVSITSVAPLRDLAPGSVNVMIKELEAWSLRCSSALNELEAEMARVRAEAARRAAREARAEKQVKGVMDASEKSGAGGPGTRTRGGGRRLGGGGGDDDEDDEMDVDGDQGGVRGPGARRGGGGALDGLMNRLGGGGRAR